MEEIANKDHVVWIAISSGSVFGALQDAVEPFEDSVGDSFFEPRERMCSLGWKMV